MLIQKEIDHDGVQGVLHLPAAAPNSAGVALTHGAGADCRTLLLTQLAEQLAQTGFHVLRFNLAFRLRRRTGPPHPGKSAEDRQSILQAVAFLRTYAPARLILGGHSYGGRQSSIAASENKSIADRLLLLSYPLHPPAKPAQLRTAHFPNLKVPSIFVHGAADSFGTPDEMQAALQLIPAQTRLVIIKGAGHDLLKGRFNLLTETGGLE